MSPDRFRGLVAGALVFLAGLGLVAGPAAAGGRRSTLIIGGDTRGFHDTRVIVPPHSRIVVVPPGSRVVVVPRTVVVPRSFYYPSYVYAPSPTYVAPSSPQWVPGYWSSQWVPQVYTYDTWVPGYYDELGNWVEGHWETRTAQSGYYQNVWVDGYWTR